MKGRNKFTASEIQRIKALIKEKEKASPDKQKSIRSAIRRIGFYYSDFRSQKDSYTVKDFEGLIRSGEITEIKSSPIKTINTSTNKVPSIVRAKKPESDKKITPTYNILKILDNFIKNRFDPKASDHRMIPDQSGNYIICLRKKSVFPSRNYEVEFKELDGLRVIYTGIASKSLRNRDFKQHFMGNNAGRSTLRKSLGVLMGCNLIPRDSDPSTGKTKFNTHDEERLTDWMLKNLIMYYLPTSDYIEIERHLIAHLNPPLNIKDNDNLINNNFRVYVKIIRSKK